MGSRDLRSRTFRRYERILRRLSSYFGGVRLERDGVVGEVYAMSLARRHGE